jgi:uncharacterized protein (UPF0303 family)
MSATDDLALLADIEIIAHQEQLLRFPSFDAITAWQLGNLMRDRLLARNAGGTIEIELAGQLLFACATPGATPGQADWIRRKRNTVRRFARSSYVVGRILERDRETLESRHGLTLADFAAHGGGFPLQLAGTGTSSSMMVGSIIVSGLPQRDDHALVTASIAEQLGLSIPTLP